MVWQGSRGKFVFRFPTSIFISMNKLCSLSQRLIPHCDTNKSFSFFREGTLE